jgi:hypothetical protein
MTRTALSKDLVVTLEVPDQRKFQQVVEEGGRYCSRCHPHLLEFKAVIKPITALLCVAAMILPAEAQTLADEVVLQYGVFEKSNLAAKVCVNEVGRMQEERNGHYETLLHAKALDPDAPTIGEISDVLGEIRAEDIALNQRRRSCALLLDELVAAATELRRNCKAYTVPTNTENEPATAANAVATNICHGSIKGGEPEKPSN